MKRKAIVEARIEIPMPEGYDDTEFDPERVHKDFTKFLERGVEDMGAEIEVFVELREVD